MLEQYFNYIFGLKLLIAEEGCFRLKNLIKLARRYSLTETEIFIQIWIRSSSTMLPRLISRKNGFLIFS